VPVNDQTISQVSSILSNLALNDPTGVLEEVVASLSDPSAVASLDTSAQKAFGLLASLPPTTEPTVQQAAISMITGIDADGNPLTGRQAAASSLFSALPAASSTGLGAIITVISVSSVSEIEEPSLKTVFNVLKAPTPMNPSTLDTLAVIVAGTASEASDRGAYNLQQAFTAGDGLSSDAANLIVQILNGESNDPVAAAVVGAVMSVRMDPAAGPAVASILEIGGTDPDGVASALSVLPVASSVRSDALSSIVGVMSSLLSSSDPENQVRANGALVWMVMA
jgi:hypothetical protein